MNVLVIGGGGREHAIVWKIAQSPLVDKIYCTPGNGGISQIADCVPIAAEDLSGLLEFAQKNKIDLTVVGPEGPLSLGIVDLFEKEGLKIFGPRKIGAQLESSKAFSKELMQKYNIPTAKYSVYTEAEKAKDEIDSFGYPVVIKADGLAAGKGVIIAQDREEALKAIADIMEDKSFGSAGNRMVVEEFLVGKEASILAFTDGKTIIPMVSAQDYKRALDSDKGLNTGGMGAVSPAFYYNEAVAGEVQETILERTLKALQQENIHYKGVLYFGLMLTDKGPQVLEYNARFGDPETEVVLPRLQGDLVEIMQAIIAEKLSEIQIQWKKEKAVCVVMASGGYPESFEKGFEIEGLEKEQKDTIVFHAGTKEQDGTIITSGGRVLVVTALDSTVDGAREKAYGRVEEIKFKNAHYRKDIARF